MKLLIFLLLLSSNAFAKPWAQVVLKRGSVSFNQQEIEQGDSIKESGKIVVGKVSMVKLFIKEWGSTIIIGPRSVMDLDLTKEPGKSKYSFTKGICRWKSALSKNKTNVQSNPGILTPNAAIAVRGTDFIVYYTDHLEETELIVLSGEVAMTGGLNKTTDRIKAGQWKGIGGRFGGNGSRVLDLPNVALKVYADRLNY